VVAENAEKNYIEKNENHIKREERAEKREERAEKRELSVAAVNFKNFIIMKIKKIE
jgi:hypothetical protein